MKIIFFLDRLEDGKVVEPNVRALEVLPSQLQLIPAVDGSKMCVVYPIPGATDNKVAILLEFKVKEPAPEPKSAKKKPGPKPKVVKES